MTVKNFIIAQRASVPVADFMARSKMNPVNATTSDAIAKKIVQSIDIPGPPAS